ncbi:hypothetical protein DYH09_04075 [bacterium CPR1]|nr:hypothetical protein [bacterium CPR1]
MRMLSSLRSLMPISQGCIPIQRRAELPGRRGGLERHLVGELARGVSQKPSRGEVWMVDPDFAHGIEQSGERPALVISDDRLNHGSARLSI